MTTFRTSALALSALLSVIAAPAFAQEVESAADEVAPPPPPPIEDDSPPPSETAAAQPPPQDPTPEKFEESLSPYGRWVDTPEYGRVWIPNNTSSDWQPYTDGQWADTSYGWSFVAAVPYGWAVYHYGRWGWRAGLGWYWVPGYHWAPAWVAWRHVNGYACWSPIGPHGYVYPHSWPGWVVVPHTHFNQPILRWRVPTPKVATIVRTARPVRGFGSVRYGGVVRVAPAHPAVSKTAPAHKH
jgi:hypothetical protein